jgi:cytochrome P450
MNKIIPSIWQGTHVKPSLSDLVQFRDQPHRFLLELVRTYGDIVWYGKGRLGFVIGAHPKHVQHVLVEGQRIYLKTTFQYRLLSDVTGDGLLTSEGDLWRERRRIQQPAFHRTRLALVSEATVRATDQMWKRWMDEGRRTVNIADEMFRLSLDVVMDVLFGHPLGDRGPEIVDATLGVLHHLIRRSRSIPGIPSWLSPGPHRRFHRALHMLDDVIGEVLKERRLRPGLGNGSLRNLLDLLIEAEDADKITPEGVRNEMITMIIAGHETVASALTWAWWLLACNPEAEAALRDEARTQTHAEGLEALATLPTARNTISEALRLYPPAWIVTRRAEPEEDSSDWLPKNTLVMLSPYVTHRLPAFWPEPDRFMPERFNQTPVPGSYFPFGTGPRLCIGKDFALVEATLVLTETARRCRLRAMSDSVSEYAGVTLQPEGGLMMEVVPL